MLNFFKKNPLKDALKILQGHHLLENPDAVLGAEQMNFIGELATFKEAEKRVERNENTAAGALAWFAANAVQKVAEGSAAGNPPAPIVIDLIEKVAHFGKTLKQHALGFSFSKGDLISIDEAVKAGEKWFSLPEREVLIADLLSVQKMIADAAEKDQASKKAVMEMYLVRKVATE